jgi:predicted alpha/beta hydrolase family esterase
MTRELQKDLDEILNSSYHLTKIEEEKILVVFIHGLSDNTKTWVNFIHYIKLSKLNSLFHIAYFTYPTWKLNWPWKKSAPKIETLAHGLNTEIRHNWRNYKNIILVCHSMGGLIAKQHLVNSVTESLGEEQKIRCALFYATPHLGSQLANITSRFMPGHNQIRQLAIGSDFVKELTSKWSFYGISETVSTCYIVGGMDKTVDEMSAKGQYGVDAVDVIPFATHKTIIKPTDFYQLPFTIFKNEMLTFINEKILREDDEEFGEPDEDEL